MAEISSESQSLNDENKHVQPEHVEDTCEEKNGRLAKMLKESIDLTIQKYLHSAKLFLFTTHFGPIHNKYPDAIKAIHSLFLSKLESDIKKEVNLIYQQETLISLLNKLDILIQKADSGQKWRPSGCPETDLRTHYYFIKEKHKKELEQILEEQLTENESLTQQIVENHKTLLEMRTEIEKKLEEYKELGKLNSSQPIKKLREFLHSCQK